MCHNLTTALNTGGTLKVWSAARGFIHKSVREIQHLHQCDTRSRQLLPRRDRSMREGRKQERVYLVLRRAIQKRKDEATEAFERFAIKAALDPRLPDETTNTLASFTRSRSFDTLVIFLEHIVSRVTAVEKDPENALELHGRLLPAGSATTALPRKSEPEPEDGDEAPASPKRRKMGRQRKPPRRSPKKMLASAPRSQPEKSEQPVSLHRSARLRASPRTHAPAPKTQPNKTTGRTRRKRENA